MGFLGVLRCAQRQDKKAIRFDGSFLRVRCVVEVWVDRMFPMIDGDFTPRQPGKQDDPTAFKSGMDWLNNILKDDFGWNLTASIVCCGEPEEGSAEYARLLELAHSAGVALGKD